MEKIIITGATGFIGRACLSQLKKMPFAIHAISRTNDLSSAENITSHSCDILNINETTALVKEIKADYLLHLAWFMEHQVCWTSTKNIPYISASAMLYHAFSEAGGKKAILMGSCAEYAKTTEKCHEDETAIKPASLYGFAKKQTYELIQHMKLNFSTYADFCWVRLFHLFGRYENENRLFPYLFNTYLKGKIPTIHNGHAIRNYTHIDTIAENIIALLHQPLTGKLNIGGQHELTIEEFAAFIHQRYFQKYAPPHFDSSFSATDRLVPDLTKFNMLSLKNNKTLAEELDDIYLFWQQMSYEKVRASN